MLSTAFVQTWPQCWVTQPHFQWKLLWLHCTIRIHLCFFSCLWSPADVFSLMLFASYSLQGKESPFLIIFLHHTFPPLRSFPRHQRSHPENQFAQEAGLFHSGCGDWHLHHTPVALHIPLMRCWLSLRTATSHCNWLTFSCFYCCKTNSTR